MMPLKATQNWIKHNILQIESSHDTRLLSYRTLRRFIGLLGIFLPLILWSGELFLQGQIIPRYSISNYYDGAMRDIFVGVLWAFGVFLVCYKGYEWYENLIATLGGISAIGVALVPVPENFSGLPLHFVFAFIFFSILIFFVLALFTKSDTKNPGKAKIIRNKIYFFCGITMIIILALIIAYKIINPQEGAANPLSIYKPVFFLESFLLIFFGISWFIKGETLFRDQDKKH